MLLNASVPLCQRSSAPAAHSGTVLQLAASSGSTKSITTHSSASSAASRTPTAAEATTATHAHSAARPAARLVPRLPDEPVSCGVVPRAVALGGLPPGCLRDAALLLAAPTAMWVVHAVHGHAPHTRAAPQPARGSRFPQLGVLVLRVGQHADGGQAARQHHALLAGGQAQHGVAVVTCVRAGWGGGWEGTIVGVGQVGGGEVLVRWSARMCAQHDFDGQGYHQLAVTKAWQGSP